MPGRCSWPLSRQRAGFGYERANVGAAGQDRSVKSVERTMEPDAAELEAERRTAGEGRHAWPGRSEIPMEQAARYPPQRLLLPRQWTPQSRKDAINGVGIGRFCITLQRGSQKIFELLVRHFQSSLSITPPSVRRRFCLPRISRVSTAETDVPRISATCALLMPSV